MEGGHQQRGDIVLQGQWNAHGSQGIRGLSGDQVHLLRGAADGAALPGEATCGDDMKVCHPGLT